MRTTLSLDDDVAAKLRDETRRRKTSFKAVVNDCLRRGLEAPSEAELATPFSVEPRPMGLRDGLDLDDVGGLLESPRRTGAAMTLVDANVLLYACDSESPHQAPARQWLAAELSSGRPVRLALITLLAVVRIAADRRVFTRPLSPGEACALVERRPAPRRFLGTGPRTTGGRGGGNSGRPMHVTMARWTDGVRAPSGWAGRP